MQKRRSAGKKWLLLLLIPALAALSYGGFLAYREGLFPWQTQSPKPRGQAEQTPAFVRHVIARGSIQNTVSGTGTLSYGSSRGLSLPFESVIAQVLVREGQPVLPGDELMRLDPNSLLESAVNLETQLAEAEASLSKLSRAYAAEAFVKAGFAGRVKAIYAAVGDQLQDFSGPDQSLALLSLDGRMAVSIPRGDLSVGQTLTVMDGRARYAGVVDHLEEEEAVVTFPDTRTLPGAEVRVLRGTAELGLGRARVNLPKEVRPPMEGYVLKLHVSVNQTVGAAGNLMRVSQIPPSSAYLLEQQRLELAAQKLSQVQQLMQTNTLTAPEAGVVSALLEAGPARIEADTALLTLHTGVPGNMLVTVDELDIGKVAPGQDAEVTIDAFPGSRYAARVVSVSRLGVYANGVTTYDVLLSLEGDDSLRAEMNGTAVISVNRADNAVLLPLGALNSAGGRQYVWRYEEGFQEQGGQPGIRTEVRTGLSDADYAEVLSGLKEGDIVLLPSGAAAESGAPGRGREGFGFDPSRMGSPPGGRLQRFPGN